MCLYVSLGPSLCPPLKGLILQLVCTFDIEIDSSAEQVEPPGRLCVLVRPHSIQPKEAKKMVQVKDRQFYAIK